MPNIGIIVTSITAFGITALLGLILIPFLKKLNFGQTIREDGPAWHKDKQGTPTMGGILFIIGVTSAVILGFSSIYITLPDFVTNVMEKSQIVMLFAGLVMALLFAGIGFIDDYIKVVKKRNLGLTALQKILLQIAVTALYLTVITIFGGETTVVNIPFLGSFDFSILYYPIMGILIIGIVNSANLTDGIDGLCTSVTFVIALFFMGISSYLAIASANILACALAASCIGFLIYNIHPAKVFMGDTGSFFFGGITMAMAFCIDMEFIMFFAGFVYCLESLSDIIQVISYKTRHKRVFKMAPIHHHFEMCGWSENKIVVVFSLITLIMCAIGVFALI